MSPGYKALKSLGYVQITGPDAATTIASAFPGGVIPLGTVMLQIIVATQAIRWRDDGTAPTAAIGYPLATGVEMKYEAADFPRLTVISQVAGAIVNVVAYGQP